MSDIKHTPGPWVMVHSKPYSVDPEATIYEADGFDEQSDEMMPIAHMETNRSAFLANGRLVVAAPDLLAALESVVADVENDVRGRLYADTLKAVYAAIAKAKGV